MQVFGLPGNGSGRFSGACRYLPTILLKREPYGRLKPIAEPPTSPLRSDSFGPRARTPFGRLRQDLMLRA